MDAADGGKGSFPALACLVPVCLLSLVTAAAGFSVGPEAPMVCVGGVLGARLAAKLPRCSSAQAKVLSVAGASAALSAFLDMPLAGCFFALELLDPTSSLGVGAAQSLSPAAVASVAALVSLATVAASMTSGAAPEVGGDLNYMGGLQPADAAGKWPASYLAMALVLGACGGGVSSCLVLVIQALKRTAAWLECAASFSAPPSPPPTPAAGRGAGPPPPPPPPPRRCASSRWRVPWRPVAVRASAGLLTGGLGVFWPHTLLWGETRLGALLASSGASDAAVHPTLTAFAWVGLGGAAPSPGLEAAQVAIAKCAAIAIAAGAGLPGGVIFPTFYAGALLARAVAVAAPDSAAAAASSAVAGVAWVAAAWLPVASVCLMASLQAATTRTPLASVMILAMAADATSNVGALLPFMAVAAYVGVWTAQLTGAALFGYPQPPPKA
jgi:H+/Cl- antiporter ClcA